MAEGILAVVLGSVAYGLGPVFVKIVLEGGISTNWCMVYRWLLAIPVSFLLIKANRLSLRINKKQFFHLLFLGTLGLGMTVFYLHVPINICRQASLPCFILHILFL